MSQGRILMFCLGLAAGVGSIVAGCSGPAEGVITFSEGSSEGTATPQPSSTSQTPSTPADAGTTAGPVNAVFVSDAFPAVNPACGSCHLAGTSGAAIFFGADANATYPLFKQRNFHLPNSAFVTRGAHTGPALTTDQRAAIDRWVAAEGGGAADGG